jgi:hypothetical protein
MGSGDKRDTRAGSPNRQCFTRCYVTAENTDYCAFYKLIALAIRRASVQNQQACQDGWKVFATPRVRQYPDSVYEHASSPAAFETGSMRVSDYSPSRSFVRLVQAKVGVIRCRYHLTMPRLGDCDFTISCSYHKLEPSLKHNYMR